MCLLGALIGMLRLYNVFGSNQDLQDPSAVNLRCPPDREVSEVSEVARRESKAASKFQRRTSNLIYVGKAIVMIRNAGNGQPNMTAWHVVDVRLDPVHQPSVGTFETREASPQVAVRNARSPGREVGLWGCATSESSEKHYGTELQWVSWSPSHQKAYARSERPKKDGFSMFSSNYPSRHRIFGCIRGPFLVSSCQDHSTDHLPAAIASSHERHNKYLIDPHCAIDRIWQPLRGTYWTYGDLLHLSKLKWFSTPFCE